MADSRGSSPRSTAPPQAPVSIGNHTFSPEKIIEVLHPYISSERAERLHDVVRARTRSVITVVEGAANYGNVSAVMRTAEGLGFFEVHVVAGRQPYRPSRRASQGAEKWLDLRVWDSPASCVGELRRRGYQIVVTEPDPNAVALTEVDFLQRTAVVFGNESEGVSSEIRRQADVTCRIDVNGFVESYNVSVAAGLVLYHAYLDRLRKLGRNGDLAASEQQHLQAEYYMLAVQHAEEILLEETRRAGART